MCRRSTSTAFWPSGRLSLVGFRLRTSMSPRMPGGGETQPACCLSTSTCVLSSLRLDENGVPVTSHTCVARAATSTTLFTPKSPRLPSRWLSSTMSRCKRIVSNCRLSHWEVIMKEGVVTNTSMSRTSPASADRLVTRALFGFKAGFAARIRRCTAPSTSESSVSACWRVLIHSPSTSRSTSPLAMPATRAAPVGWRFTLTILRPLEISSRSSRPVGSSLLRLKRMYLNSSYCCSTLGV